MHRGDLSIKLKMDIIVSLTDTKKRDERLDSLYWNIHLIIITSMKHILIVQIEGNIFLIYLRH